MGLERNVLHSTLNTHAIFTKLANFVEKGIPKEEKVKQTKQTKGGGGVDVLVSLLTAPSCDGKGKTPNILVGAIELEFHGWGPIQIRGGCNIPLLYTQNPCHFHHSCQFCRERHTEGIERLKQWGWCARCLLTAPSCDGKGKTKTIFWLGTYSNTGWVQDTSTVHSKPMSFPVL